MTYVERFTLCYKLLCTQDIEKTLYYIEKIHLFLIEKVVKSFFRTVTKMETVYSYGLLTASTVMFGFEFFFKDIFRKHYGSGLKATLVMNIGSSIFGLLSLLLINGFIFEYSHFALVMALISVIFGLLFSFCSLKALGKINLSLYSLFSMLGGMVLPFVSGILLHGEALTVGKLVCFGIITVALSFTAEKGEKNSGVIYYVGVFVFNGMAGVIAKLYQSLEFEKISSAGFSILKAVVSIVLSGLILIIVKGEKRKINLPVIVSMAGSGALGNIANWLLLIALLNLPASAQYPFVTGGTMIVSTIISAFSDKKPNKREILAVILAFVAVLILIMIPDVVLFKINW